MNKSPCAEDPSNPLHLTTLSKKEPPRDPQLESLLSQGGGPRLQQINQEMYQTLRSLDAELRRERQVAACKRGTSDIQSLQARSTPDSGNGNGVGSAGNSGTGAVDAGRPNAASVGHAGGVGGSGTAGAGGFASDRTTVAATGARTTLIRKASVPPTTTGGGGNGATAQNVSAGSDNDVVARRLRKAAEQETDPVVKARLWKEYAQYQQGIAAK